jgi:hypothetical protein
MTACTERQLPRRVFGGDGEGQKGIAEEVQL